MGNVGQYRELAQALADNETPCQDLPDIFFPEDFPDKETRERAIRLARTMCATCPVKLQCFQYAIEAKEPYGIWAGTLPHER